jgi:ABC-type glutathione transport system ATPase component
MDKAIGWLKRLDLIDKANTAAGDLPYGMQRRIEIARALCVDPLLLCLDEPAAGLNPRESAELNELLKHLAADEGIAILLIEHDMSVVMNVSDHICVLNYGRKIAEGTPAHIQQDRTSSRPIWARTMPTNNCTRRPAHDAATVGCPCPLWKHPRPARRRCGGAGRRGGDPDRRQRRRQVDADDVHLRPAARLGRAHRLRRRRHHRPADA